MIEILVIAVPKGNDTGGISQHTISGFHSVDAAKKAVTEIENRFMRSNFAYVNAVVITKA